ncbi:MBL fold metallo-hydrolase [Geobacter pelophilus]|uniref:MBL fold metallo-hydrolase n=1 Tax=Geoanaerobacter pelophilus TaxID=60036 RepID=A0AAW4L7I1_9BACT|nr:MBL fold metallo-hydrolase [Geoanaerobacter pelophilus]MBT0665805.1 MBL fold metallo-hydrolase [Geoanaerobacter pelophilus]
MKLCLLASGSKGNSVYIESGETCILVDSGCSGREICKRLESRGLKPEKLAAVFITHEHSDHISGVGALARKLKIPVIVSHRTQEAASRQIGKCDIIEFQPGTGFQFRDLHIDPFPITHDACDPVGFVIESSEGKTGVATDLGIATRLVKDKLQGCRALVLESNHDEEMLMNGPYPWHLKQRIKSRHGHLSNAESVDLLQDILHGELAGLFLAHLSEVNNDPEKALAATTSFLAGQNTCNPQLFVGNQYQPSLTLTL